MATQEHAGPSRQPASLPPAGESDASRAAEPIAVVGMACRFPGAPDLDAFWQLLVEGRNAVTEGVPGSGEGRLGEIIRDPEVQNEACRYGAFVDDIERFDASFFRISPVEAELLDPQQRMMLEMSWLALEDAGMDPDRLRGSRTGVYAGTTGSEYRELISASGRADSYLGTSSSVTAGRVSYALGLEGPAMSLEMACASALAAVHQAVTGLQRGEVDIALAGGVHAALSPPVARFMLDAGMLSPSGECRTFDASADGFVRGEGCGVLVLKRLSEAEADGDRIWGVIRGSAVNQNGASLGLTVPNGPAQERVMEEALARAGVESSEVDYLEAHATGSNMADPIEVRAVAAVYGRGREPDRPLLIGSVKTNIGHMEAAAGVASLIKAVLAMQRGVIPKHLHFSNPNPDVEWDRLPIRVTTDMTQWPAAPDRPPRAGVSAFGISGANAHVIVEGYAEPEAPAAGSSWPAGPAMPVDASAENTAFDSTGAGRETRLLPLSGKTDRALRELAERYLSWLDEHPGQFPPGSAEGDAALADMAWTGCGRLWNAARRRKSRNREPRRRWRSSTPPSTAGGWRWGWRCTRASRSSAQCWTAATRHCGRSVGPRCWT